MNISTKLNNNNIYFSGIKLSNPKFEDVRDIAMNLKCRGYNVFGHKTFYVNNNFESKIKIFKFIRSSNYFSVDDFGFVFLPWSKEAYVVGSPIGEQLLLPKIMKLDKKAHINLML